MRILVTGASGFIWRALVDDLAAQGHRVRAAMRQPADIFSRAVEVVAVSDLARPLEWRPLLSDSNAVVHLAGIAHGGQVVDLVPLGDEDEVGEEPGPLLLGQVQAKRIQGMVEPGFAIGAHGSRPSLAPSPACGRGLG